MATSVTSLRRYPVKSMGGEALVVAELDSRGFVGDRWYVVQDGDGRFASGKDTRRFRRRDGVFDYAAHTEPDGRVVVAGSEGYWYVGDPCLDERLSAEMGTAVRVVPEVAVPHQDMGSISIVSTATMRWCADRSGGSPDARRLRVNIVVEADEPFVEEQWLEHELVLGSTHLRVSARVPRCRMIDLRQDSVEPGVKWLGFLAQERAMCLAVYADVLRPGRISVGDHARQV